jgi:hypothetical protein
MALRLSVLRAGRPLPPGRFLVLVSIRGCVNPRAIVHLEGLCQLKYPMTSSGIETAKVSRDRSSTKYFTTAPTYLREYEAADRKTSPGSLTVVSSEIKHCSWLLTLEDGRKTWNWKYLILTVIVYLIPACSSGYVTSNDCAIMNNYLEMAW